MTPDITRIVSIAVMQGIMGAAALFLKTRNLEYDDDSLGKLTAKLSEEFALDNPEAFVFSLPDSIRKPIDDVLAETIPTLLLLRGTEEGDSQFSKVVRVLTSGETIVVLDKHAGEVIKLYETL
jgi:hypothetical protein